MSPASSCYLQETQWDLISWPHGAGLSHRTNYGQYNRSRINVYPFSAKECHCPCEGLQGFISLVLRMGTFEVRSPPSAGAWGTTRHTPLSACNGLVEWTRNVSSWCHRVCHLSQHNPALWPTLLPVCTPSHWRANLHVVAFTLTILLGPWKLGDWEFKSFRNLFSSLFSSASLYVIWSSASYSWTGGREKLLGGTRLWGGSLSSYPVLFRAPRWPLVLVTTSCVFRHWCSMHTSRCALRRPHPDLSSHFYTNRSMLSGLHQSQCLNILPTLPPYPRFRFLELSAT